MEQQRLTVRYEVPITWLIGGFGVVASSLFYAGWQASDLKMQLESAVRLQTRTEYRARYVRTFVVWRQHIAHNRIALARKSKAGKLHSGGYI